MLTLVKPRCSCGWTLRAIEATTEATVSQAVRTCRNPRCGWRWLITLRPCPLPGGGGVAWLTDLDPHPKASA